jgi:hypothetical protein
MPKRKGAGFAISSGTYHYEECGKLTRDTGEGGAEVGLCGKCYREGELRNAHSDGDHDEEPDPNCPECQCDEQG